MEGFGFSLRLLQFLACSASAQHVKDSIVAITGSSVLLPGTDKGFGSLQWEFSKPGKILPILDYIGGHQQAYDQYKNRIELNKSDGTLLLKDVREGDTGRYKMTVDLDPIRTRIVTLRVFDPLSRPTVFCNGSLDGSPVLLICTVERGRADTIHWSRGQRPRVRLGLHMAGVLLCLVIVALSIFFAWMRVSLAKSERIAWRAVKSQRIVAGLESHEGQTRKTRESATFTETQ
ncbi:CD48 antigen-like isoform X3 [Stegostoma tigrinum]|uniref:CD48 antigen-like isoform X3 n=1 Tax=Stegostoma tigrinum TaxID=3053191 RepID=UPI0028700CBD|nr:CD48 antigen-like isoform X3 [Stegostoma tigrinum]